jgi:hypothetical protein
MSIPSSLLRLVVDTSPVPVGMRVGFSARPKGSPNEKSKKRRTESDPSALVLAVCLTGTRGARAPPSGPRRRFLSAPGGFQTAIACNR